MSASRNPSRQHRRVPDGYVAAAISTGQKAAPVRVSVLAKSEPDPVAGHLVLIRQTADAKVFLGALVDVGGHVHAWLEIWVQSLDAVASGVFGWREMMSNALLDQRWQRQAELLTALDAAQEIRTGWEGRHPVPIWLDVAKAEPIAPTDSTGETWKLCQDDALLSASGLPEYSSTLHRYLYLAKKGAEGGFVPVTQNAPTNDKTRGMDVLTGGRTDLVPFNPAGGLLLIRQLVGMPYESYIDLLASGRPGTAVVMHGKSMIPLWGMGRGEGESGRGGEGETGRRGDEAVKGGTGASAPPHPLSPSPPPNSGWLLLGTEGKWGRVLEGFYLRLRALADVVETVREYVTRTQSPLLNLEPSRFQVHLPGADSHGYGPPTLWTAKGVLVDPSDTLEVEVEGTSGGAGERESGGKKDGDMNSPPLPVAPSPPPAGPRFFLPGRPLPASVYRPWPIGQSGDLDASVRVREVKTADGMTSLHGTLITQERIDAGPQDLVRIWLPLGATRVRLHARCEPAPSRSAGVERRFHAMPQKLDDEVSAKLKAAEGITIPAVRFDVLPLLGTPWDLYSIAVIGVRSVLVNGGNSLGIALDELLSLARQIAAGPRESFTLALRQRVRAALEADKQIADALGRQRLAWNAEGETGRGGDGEKNDTAAGLSPAASSPTLDATDVIPPELWFDVLAMLIKAFPGIGPDSTFKSFGDVSAAEPQRAFDVLLADLENILIRTRSLILVDWRQNREIGGVLRDAMREVIAGGKPAAQAAPPQKPAGPTAAVPVPPAGRPGQPARRAPAETPFR